MQPTHTRVNQSSTSPSVRKAGTYQIHLSPDCERFYGSVYAVVYRNGRMLTTVRAGSDSAALSEARRNVRLARKAGGL